jgi:hypothetical protein
MDVFEMQRSIVLIIFITLMLNFAGCDSDDNVTDNDDNNIVGTGDVVSKTVNLPPFHSIINTAIFEVSITKGSPQKVVLKAQQNILDVMTYEVNDQKLTLGFEENISVTTSKEVEAEITVAEINNISSFGAGNFELSGTKQNELNISITGAGNVEAYNLEVDSCYITITGVGNSKVRVNNLLDVTISGVGNVYYKGNPIIISNTTGTGRIIDDN